MMIMNPHYEITAAHQAAALSFAAGLQPKPVLAAPQNFVQHWPVPVVNGYGSSDPRLAAPIILPPVNQPFNDRPGLTFPPPQCSNMPGSHFPMNGMIMDPKRGHAQNFFMQQGQQHFVPNDTSGFRTLDKAHEAAPCRPNVDVGFVSGFHRPPFAGTVNPYFASEPSGANVMNNNQHPSTVHSAPSLDQNKWPETTPQDDLIRVLLASSTRHKNGTGLPQVSGPSSSFQNGFSSMSLTSLRNLLGGQGSKMGGSPALSGSQAAEGTKPAVSEDSNAKGEQEAIQSKNPPAMFLKGSRKPPALSGLNGRQFLWVRAFMLKQQAVFLQQLFELHKSCQLQKLLASELQSNALLEQFLPQSLLPLTSESSSTQQKLKQDVRFLLNLPSTVFNGCLDKQLAAKPGEGVKFKPSKESCDGSQIVSPKPSRINSATSTPSIFEQPSVQAASGSGAEEQHSPEKPKKVQLGFQRVQSKEKSPSPENASGSLKHARSIEAQSLSSDGNTSSCAVRPSEPVAPPVPVPTLAPTIIAPVPGPVSVPLTIIPPLPPLFAQLHTSSSAQLPTNSNAPAASNNSAPVSLPGLHTWFSRLGSSSSGGLSNLDLGSTSPTQSLAAGGTGVESLIPPWTPTVPPLPSGVRWWKDAERTFGEMGLINPFEMSTKHPNHSVSGDCIGLGNLPPKKRSKYSGSTRSDCDAEAPGVCEVQPGGPSAFQAILQRKVHSNRGSNRLNGTCNASSDHSGASGELSICAKRSAAALLKSSS